MLSDITAFTNLLLLLLLTKVIRTSVPSIETLG